MKVSSAQAARMLGVSRMQISRLVDAGELVAERFGNAWQIDLDSVHRYADLRPERGRPLSAARAWTALRTELPRTLDDASVLAIRVRRRAERRPSRVLPGDLERYRQDSRCVQSGSAVASRLAPVSDGPPHSSYVRRSDYEEVARDYALADDAANPNVILRIVDDDVWPFADLAEAPPVVALVDLVDERDDRSARELVLSL